MVADIGQQASMLERPAHPGGSKGGVGDAINAFLGEDLMQGAKSRGVRGAGSNLMDTGF